MKSKYRTDFRTKEKIDEILKEMASTFANTGKDSTAKEMREAYQKESRLIDKIGKIDKEFEGIIRPYKDEEWKTKAMKQ